MAVITIIKRISKVMAIALIGFIAFILLITVVLLAYSSGKPKPYTDSTGKLLARSLSEKVFLTIGGIKQGMFIKSKDSTNPVLLYIHGGMPEYFLTQNYPTGIEEFFTIVWWEQRGSGISYSSKIPRESLNLEQMIIDVLEVTNYLRHRFGQEKIYLMGHSGGTFIGIQAAARAPQQFHAYIGVAQMSEQIKSEQLAYDYMLEQLRLHKEERMVKKLENAPVSNKTPNEYLKIRDKAMHSLGIGTTHDMKSVFTGIFIPSLTCRDYTLTEKINMWRGKAQSGVSVLWNEMLTTKLINKVPKLEIPIYFIGGIYDYTVSYTLSKEYFDNIQAPLKGFYTFKNSAHSPLFEEPKRMQSILKEDVLKGSNLLAD